MKTRPELMQTIYDQDFTTVTPFNNSESLFSDIVVFTEKCNHYFPGERNNFISLLSQNLNRSGMNEVEAEKLIMLNYPKLSSKIELAVKEAYALVVEHDMFGPGYYTSATSATFAIGSMRQSTPLIPDAVFHHLPDLLNECTTVFNVPRERDVFLTGALTILSGCFSKIVGLYDNRPYSPNLFSFIIAPPASGKGVLSYSRQLAQVIHENIKPDAESSDRLTQNGGEQFTHFIPADSSSAAVKRLLQRNNGQGTICETEADTLSATLQQDWGGYDDLLRKAFHHEQVSFARVGDKDDVKLGEIKHPRLTVCLSGTPSQVPSLLKNTENGLFSRFIFYTYHNDGVPTFKDVFAKVGPANLESHFNVMADKVFKMFDEALKTGTVDFEMTPDQQHCFISQFDDRLKRFDEQFGEETRGVVFRLGLITFRIAMVLTIVRSLGEKSFSKTIICTDEDFETSIILSDIYLDHSMVVFQSLHGYRKVQSNAMTFLDFLPAGEFTYSTALNIGDKICGFGERSISSYLKELVSKQFLKQPKRNGTYIKN